MLIEESLCNTVLSCYNFCLLVFLKEIDLTGAACILSLCCSRSILAMKKPS